MIAKSILRSRRQISLWIMIAVYLAAGINHFRMPAFYFPLIPDYMSNKSLLNILSGIAEILLSIGLIVPATRKWACYGVIALLIAFLPTHVWMITENENLRIQGFGLPVWGAWVRILVIHPILLYWAWYHRNTKNP